MPRTMLSDEHWSKLKPIMIKNGVYLKPDLKKTVEGILYKLRVGCPWRDLPHNFGRWNSIFKCFNRWSEKRVFETIFETLSSDSDWEWVFIDGSVVKAHQHATGAQKGAETAIGKSVAGNSSKISLAVDSMGLPIKLVITEGQVHDSKVAPELLSMVLGAEIVIADKGYDSEAIRKNIEEMGAAQVIPRKSNSNTGNKETDWDLYKLRHLVENAFARLKHFRSVATRYDKLARNYRSMVLVACSYIWLPM